jgi:UDP-N-acetylglucosamine--N-acetylmuramyl-(pentapeptide) pyrophosphoryl-undecaprenol N-acetylglucosamine transferase
MPHTVILAGGGTGGHVYPALAMGDALRAAGHTVHYYGDGARLEGRVAPQRGYLFRAVEGVPFPRAGLAARLKFAWQLVIATLAARSLLRKDGATLVLGVGGYVMAPSVLAAWTLGLPAVIHESNVSPGLANRLCARVSRLVLLTYDATRGKLGGAAEMVTVGCPVNPGILEGSAGKYRLPEGRRVLLVVGGSLGAATINAVALAAAAAAGRDYAILHLTGPRYFDEVAAAYQALPAGSREGVVLVPYEDQMGDAYAAADLVLARAGSSTLAELCAVGKPSVLVPSPNVTDNHQEANARGMEAVGAAMVFVERQLEPTAVAAELGPLLSDPVRLSTMANAAQGLGRRDVAESIATLILERLDP